MKAYIYPKYSNPNHFASRWKVQFDCLFSSNIEHLSQSVPYSSSRNIFQGPLDCPVWQLSYSAVYMTARSALSLLIIQNHFHHYASSHPGGKLFALFYGVKYAGSMLPRALPDICLVHCSLCPDLVISNTFLSLF